MRVGEHDAVGHVGFGQRGGVHLAGEVAGFVGIALAAAGAAAQSEADVVLGEDVGQALDFSGVRDREQNLIAGGRELLYFLQHRRNGAVKARGRLRQQVDRAVLRPRRG